MPLGRSISFSIISKRIGCRPRSAKARAMVFGLRILKTIDSPKGPGKMEVLTSMSLVWARMVKRPSWALSWMFNFSSEISLILERIREYVFLSKKTTSCKTPSSRVLKRAVSSWGSIWTSEASKLKAPPRIASSISDIFRAWFELANVSRAVFKSAVFLILTRKLSIFSSDISISPFEISVNSGTSLYRDQAFWRLFSETIKSWAV